MRLSKEDAQATALQGWLYMHSKLPVIGKPHCRAHLLDRPDTDLAFAQIILDHPWITVISGGIRLAGFEYVHNKQIRQDWWIVPQ